jgi:hypothetical protein
MAFPNAADGPLRFSHDVWHEWTAPTSGVLTLSTAGSNYDTVVLIGRLYCPESSIEPCVLEDVSSNGNYGTSKQSFLQVPVVAGQWYFIPVSGTNLASGSYVLQHSLNAPAADVFAKAKVLSGNTGTVFGSNRGATSEPGEKARRTGTQARHTLWFTWKPSIAGRAVVSAAGNYSSCCQFDPAVSVWTGNSVGGLTLVATNDDASTTTTTATTSFNAVAGTTYRISIDSEANLKTGSYRLDHKVPG